MDYKQKKERYLNHLKQGGDFSQCDEDVDHTILQDFCDEGIAYIEQGSRYIYTGKLPLH